MEFSSSIVTFFGLVLLVFTLVFTAAPSASSITDGKPRWMIFLLGTMITGLIMLMSLKIHNESETAQYKINNAYKFLKENKFNEAIKLLETVSSEDPNHKKTANLIDSIQKAKIDFVEKEKTDRVNSAKAEVMTMLETASEFYKANKIDGFMTNNDEIANLLDTLDRYDRFIKIGINSEHADIKELAKELEPKSMTFRKNSMVRIRKEFAINLSTRLWEQDIDVSSSGTSITFVGGLFAANRNIKDFQTTFSESLKRLGFKRVNYKWYKGQDDYTYYDL